MSVVKIIIMRSINLRMHDYFTQCSTLHNRDADFYVHEQTLRFFVSVSLPSIFNSATWNRILKETKKKTPNDWNPLFALLIHAMLSSVAAGETRGWGLLSLLLTV